MEVKEILELMKAVSDHDFTKFELEHGETKLIIKREKENETLRYIKLPDTNQMAAPVLGAEKAQGDAAESGIKAGNVITCPLVGTFYTSPAPDAEQFIQVGDHVKKGQVIGIVEAMKLMNEIESEYDGVVAEVLVSDAEAVEYGQPLFRIV